MGILAVGVGTIIGIIILAVVVCFVLFLVTTYNKLIKLKQMVSNAWSQIDVQLQRRFDLIPNLIECVKKYMSHEKETLEKIAELRTSWANAKEPSAKMKLESELAQSLKTIFAVAEGYPELKANTNFLSLQESLEDTESKVAYARQFYNDTVTKYNTSVKTFPNSIIAGMFHFDESALFTVEDETARKAVKVDFDK
jgi:LemA protein